MAKKKKEFTLEELLEQALVPEREQQYIVPDNWVWVRLESVSEIVTGGTPSKSKEHFYGGKFPFIKPADLDQARHVVYATEYLSDEGKKVSRIIPPGSTSVCCIGTIGKCGFLDVEATTNQQINSIIPKINRLFMYYYCNSDSFINQLLNLVSSTTISIINKGKMLKTSLPLPPLAEQQRIVDRIESLFEKLDQAKGLIQEALNSFENRKAAILHKAFTGELSKKWREEHGVGMESWEMKPLSQLCDSFQYGTSKKSETEGNVVVIRMGNLQNGEINWDNLAYTNDEEDIKKYKLKNGDVLFNRTNSPELVGKTSIYRGDHPAIFAGYLIRMNYNDLLDGSYLNYVMNSTRAKKYCNEVKTDGVNQSNINAKKISKFTVPWCSLPEQQEIVCFLDDIFKKEQSAKELYDIIDNIDFMKKSILARAFRGELGTNDPAEESSKKLLKEFLKYRE